MIDKQGFRANVGIILINKEQQVFWGGRVGQPDAWQFPQGGIDEGEVAEETLFRELREEIGLHPDDVKILGQTERWMRYKLPKKYRRYYSKPICVGQKQKWFLLEMRASEDKFDFNVSEKAEFDRWRWVDYWYPVENVIEFKENIYKRALEYFTPTVFGEQRSFKKKISN
jgi:putative (di)nucleoside polyphosphate hydrolase